MLVKIYYQNNQYTYYNQNKIVINDLIIEIKKVIVINNKEYRLFSRIISHNDYFIYFDSSKNLYFNNFKYNLVKYIDIGNKQANLITVKYLKDIVVIENQKLVTQSQYVFVNNVQVNNYLIKENDIIEIFNLRLIFYKHFIVCNYSNIDIDKFKIYKYYQNDNINKTISPVFRYCLKKPDFNIKLKPIHLNTINDENNALNFLPMILMAISSSLVGGMSAYNGFINQQPLRQIIIYLVFPISMLISSLVIMPLSKHLIKKKNIIKNYNLIQDYEKYLKEIYIKAQQALLEFYNYLNERNQTFIDLVSLKRIYYKQAYHDDFLCITIGMGKVKTDFSLNINTDETKILTKIQDYQYKIKWLKNSFIEVNIVNYTYISIINYHDYFNYILLQLISYYPANVYNLVFLLDKKTLIKYSYFKYIKHIIYKNNRLIATNINEVKEIKQLLENNTKETIVIVFNQILLNYLSSSYHYLIVVDNKDKVHLKSEIVIDSYNKKAFIDNEYIDFKFKSGPIINTIKALNTCSYEYINNINHSQGVYELLNINNINEFVQPQYNHQLQVNIGYNKFDEIVNLDISENAYGPHGIIAGMTGSGKSELLNSILLLLAINYDPKNLNIIIIDFKGTNLISNLSFNKTTIPHIVNSLSNIDIDTIDRAMLSFKIECSRRLQLFDKMSKLTNETSMNIDIYQKVYRDDYNIAYLPHLLIVIDEFAELKTKNPDFIKEIISLARIGRSLGIHLLLATQKVSGNINQEILANISYRICMKLNDVAESKLLLDNAAAYYLKEPGEFYLFHNSQIEYGKGVLSNISSDLKALNENVILLDHMLHHLKKQSFRKLTKLKQNEEIVNYINKKYSNYSHYSLWLKPLKIQKYADIQLNKRLIIGQYDDIFNRKQAYLEFDIFTNSILFSLDNKLKINFLNNVIYTINQSIYKCIILDFNYNLYQKYNGVKNVLTISEDENHMDDIIYFLKFICNEKVLIIINNAGKMFEQYFNISKYIVSLINGENVNYKLLLITSNYQSIPYKYLNLIKNRFSLAVKSKSELLNIYEEIPKQIFEYGIYYNSNYYNFKLIKSTDVVFIKEVNTKVFRIPSIINYEKNNNQLLLGYDLDTYQKIYLNCSLELVVTSFNNQILEKYRYIFKNDKNIKIINYENIVKSNKNYLRVLFLKPGIKQQYIFDNRVDVDKDDQAIYLFNHQIKKIRYVNARICNSNI